MTFDKVFDRVIGIEAGYVNNPKDPGGETKWGISKRAYPHLDIASLTRDEAKELYRKDLWEKIEADNLPDAVSYQVMDFAVNSGMETAIRYLQRAIGVADDGHWGPTSMKVSSMLSQTDMVLMLCSERLEFMTKLDGWPTFGRGWARRIALDLKYGAEDT